MKNKVALIILDGFGLPRNPMGSAITVETMPYFHELMSSNLVAKLDASEEMVGLDIGQAGNSEVGHATIGAGRVLESKLGYIKNEFANGNWKNSHLWGGIKKNNRLHVAGILSDAGVHAHISTMIQTVTLALEHGIQEINIHLFLDGLDSAGNSASQLIHDIQSAIAPHPQVRIGLIMGRIWAADRSGDLKTTKYCIDALNGSVDVPVFCNAFLEKHIECNGNERDFPPHLVNSDALIEAGDTIILTNHRSDRTKQLCELLVSKYAVYTVADLSSVSGANVFFPAQCINGGLIDIAVDNRLKVEVIAETCKFKHVTYFLNGFKENNAVKKFEIPTIDDQSIKISPDMSIDILEESVIKSLERAPDLLCVNVPNLDQVGHTGDLALTKEAARHVDKFLRSVLDKAFSENYIVAITSDHGNADEMLDANGDPLGSHSKNPVPLLLASPVGGPIEMKKSGSLANVAPTILSLMGISIPEYMHHSLVIS